MKPCPQHKHGLHPNDFDIRERVSYHLTCSKCGLSVSYAAMANGPREAIIAADRDWYIRELES